MVAGVYKIINIANQRIYVGSSSNIESRWRTHLSALRHHRHGNPVLQEDWDNYGMEVFAFHLLEQIDDKEERFDREQFYIDSLSDKYNICPISRNSSKRPVSDKTREKMAKSHTGRIHSLDSRIKRSVKLKGRIVGAAGQPKSAKTRAKISAALKGRPNPRKGIKNSPETIERMRQARKEWWANRKQSN